LELKEKCVPGTIDAVVVGGNTTTSYNEKMADQWYHDQINFLGNEVRNALNFEPTIVDGPKTTPGPDQIYYDNNGRKFYFIRPKIIQETQNFVPSEIKDQNEEN